MIPPPPPPEDTDEIQTRRGHDFSAFFPLAAHGVAQTRPQVALSEDTISFLTIIPRARVGYEVINNQRGVCHQQRKVE